MVSVFVRILLLFIVLAGGAISHAQAKDTITILLFGDSITAGYGLAQEKSLPVRLEALLREKGIVVKVVNGGVSGDTTGGGRSRLAWTLERHKPDLAVLALGGNDLLRGLPPEVTQENLAAMLRLLREHKITTILSAVQAPPNLGAEYHDAFNRIYPELAKEYNVPLYPFLLEKVFGDPALMLPDGIHPNARGAELIARDLAAYLDAKAALK